MSEATKANGLTDFDFEPLVVSEGLGWHPEWVVTEGLVGSDMLQGPIWLPRVVARGLEQADAELAEISDRFAQIGSFDAALGIYLLAGWRQREANQEIEAALRSMPDASRSGCLVNPEAHTDGRGVDVALVFRHTGELAGNYTCYGNYYYSKNEKFDTKPVSFPGVARLDGISRSCALLLLRDAMHRQGFISDTRNFSEWHFVYAGD